MSRRTPKPAVETGFTVKELESARTIVRLACNSCSFDFNVALDPDNARFVCQHCKKEGRLAGVAMRLFQQTNDTQFAEMALALEEVQNGR